MEDDKDEFNNAIKYFQSIISNNISTCSQHKIGVTFIGIKTNIFNNVFTIKIVNPYLYMVPFPVKPIIIQTVKKLNNYVVILQ